MMQRAMPDYGEMTYKKIKKIAIWISSKWPSFCDPDFLYQ